MACVHVLPGIRRARGAILPGAACLWWLPEAHKKGPEHVLRALFVCLSVSPAGPGDQR